MSSIVIQGDTSGSITVEAPSVAGTHTLTLPKATGNIATDATVGLGTKNLIINGDMRIDQRNAGASVTPTNGSFITDRFRQLLSTTNKYTGQQVSDAPSGFTNSLKLTSLSAYTVPNNFVFGVGQRIEGNNIAHLDWGTANAKDVTLSFWVKSSLTGTLSGAVTNNTDAAYPFDYTISSANTWEKKTINISGSTIGTWLTTNGIGVDIKYMIGIDPAGIWANTPNVWTAANEFGATTQNVNIVGTSGATWQITGVQLEVGENATPFENRMYSQELAMCQRYFYSLGGTANYEFMTHGMYVGTTTVLLRAELPVKMRAAPTLGSTGTFLAKSGNSNLACASFSVDQAATQTFSFSATISGGSSTVGYATLMFANASTATRLTFSAEL
jgi:hypothetical protein